ncbi:MAG: rod shape-determining protein MreC [Rikenellaceae bacterium]
MNRLFQFIKKIYLFLFFIILEVLAFNTYQDSSVYTRGQLFIASNNVMIAVYEKVNNLKSYFELRKTNDELALSNAQLAYRLSLMEDLNLRLLRGEVIDTLTKQDTIDTLLMDTTSFSSDTTIILADVSIKKDRYISARVVNNSVSKRRNYITLDRGELDSIKINNPVVCNNVVIGYIVAVSKNYSVAISVLNTDFRTSGMLKRDGSLCSVFWNGDKIDEVDFSGISRYSDIQVGDTIVTTGFSSYFTGGKLIGTIKEFEIKDQMYYGGKLKLFISFDKLRYVEIIYPENIDERLMLEDSLENKIL